MNTVLVQELLRFNRLLGVVRAALREMRRALRGQVLMSAELEQVFSAMIVGKVREPGEGEAGSRPLRGGWTSEKRGRRQQFMCA